MRASYTEARDHFARLWDLTIETREPVIVVRRGSEDIAMLPVLP